MHKRKIASLHSAVLSKGMLNLHIKLLHTKLWTEETEINNDNDNDSNHDNDNDNDNDPNPGASISNWSIGNSSKKA